MIRYVLLYLFLFLTGSMLGYGLETLFRRFFSAKKWVNPGFMKGPWLPLYGFGIILMFTLSYLCIAFFPRNIHFYNPLGGLFGLPYSSGPTIADLIPISLMWIGMNLLELLAGLIFIKGFHVKLWDYTNVKGNLMGIVCPLFSILWLIAALVFYYGISPFLYVLAENVFSYMFGKDGIGAHFGFIFALGIAYGLLIYDLVVSLGLFGTIAKFARESGVVARYEEARAMVSKGIKEGKSKFLPERKEKPKEKDALLRDKFLETFYIDPEKEKRKSENYDEKGRPIKEGQPKE